MIDPKTICLRCRYFRLDNEQGGVCRVDKHLTPNYPCKAPEDGCDRWRDCGQQYYIRLGWLKKSQAQLLEKSEG